MKLKAWLLAAILSTTPALALDQLGITFGDVLRNSDTLITMDDYKAARHMCTFSFQGATLVGIEIIDRDADVFNVYCDVPSIDQVNMIRDVPLKQHYLWMTGAQES